MLRTLLIPAFCLISTATFAADLPADLAAVVDAAAAQDLPTSPLEAKAVEGLAKGVPEARIASVLDGLLADLQRSQALVGAGSDDLIYAGARALKAGASDRAVATLAPGPVGERALHSLADLLALGVTEADAVRVVRVAAASSGASTHTAGLATSVAALVSRGSSPTEAADQVLAGLSGQSNGVGSMPDGAPGKKDNPGNPFGLTKGSKGKAPTNPGGGKP